MFKSLRCCKESFGHWLFHCHYYEDVDPIIVSSRCPSQLLCLVGELLLSFLMVKFLFPKSLVDFTACMSCGGFEERYVRSFDVIRIKGSL